MSTRFPLATVLRVRVLHEEREERLLMQILQEIARTRQSISTVASDILLGHAELSARMPDAIEGRDLQHASNAIKSLQQYREELKDQLEKLEQLKETQLARYRAARTNREMLSNLHHKYRAAWLTTRDVREQRMLDDNFASRRFREL